MGLGEAVGRSELGAVVAVYGLEVGGPEGVEEGGEAAEGIDGGVHVDVEGGVVLGDGRAELVEAVGRGIVTDESDVDLGVVVSGRKHPAFVVSTRLQGGEGAEAGDAGELIGFDGGLGGVVVTATGAVGIGARNTVPAAGGAGGGFAGARQAVADGTASAVDAGNEVDDEATNTCPEELFAASGVDEFAAEEEFEAGGAGVEVGGEVADESASAAEGAVVLVTELEAARGGTAEVAGAGFAGGVVEPGGVGGDGQKLGLDEHFAVVASDSGFVTASITGDVTGFGDDGFLVVGGLVGEGGVEEMAPEGVEVAGVFVVEILIDGVEGFAVGVEVGGEEEAAGEAVHGDGVVVLEHLVALLGVEGEAVPSVSDLIAASLFGGGLDLGVALDVPGGTLVLEFLFESRDELVDLASALGEAEIPDTLLECDDVLGKFGDELEDAAFAKIV